MTHLTIRQPENEKDIATLFTDDGVVPRIGETIHLDGHQYRVSDVQYLLSHKREQFPTSVSSKLINVKILVELIY